MLQYFFGAYEYPEEGRPLAPDPLWMRLAVLIKRGELSIGDVPLQLLDRFIEGKTSTLRGYPEGPVDQNKERHERELNAATEIKRSWETRVQDSGDKMEALVDAIGSSYINWKG